MVVVVVVCYLLSPTAVLSVYSLPYDLVELCLLIGLQESSHLQFCSVRYRDSVHNTVEANSRIFVII